MITGTERRTHTHVRNEIRDVLRGLKPESIKLYLIEGRYGDRGLLQIELTAFRRDDDLFQRLAKGRRRAELYSGKNSR